MASLKLTPVNHSNADLLTLSAAPGGDIVGHPAMADVAIAFQFAATVSKVSIPAERFKSARVTVTWPADFMDWDQAGLLFVRPLPALPVPSKENPGTATTFPPFAKIGLEACLGSTFYTVSACTDRAPDWNTWPLPRGFHEQHHKATIEMVRHGDGLIALLVEGEGATEKKSVIRLIPWAFKDLKEGEPDLFVGIFASRPDFKHEAKGPFTVKFSDLLIETDNDGSLKL
jgi:hypothetical protein